MKSGQRSMSEILRFAQNDKGMLLSILPHTVDTFSKKCYHQARCNPLSRRGWKGWQLRITLLKIVFDQPIGYGKLCADFRTN
jgi:hypothetical protein